MTRRLTRAINDVHAHHWDKTGISVSNWYKDGFSLCNYQRAQFVVRLYAVLFLLSLGCRTVIVSCSPMNSTLCFETKHRLLYCNIDGCESEVMLRKFEAQIIGDLRIQGPYRRQRGQQAMGRRNAQL
jgi:hypothetical protein